MKFFSEIWSKLKFPGEFLVVECHIGQEASAWNVAHFKRKGDQLELIETKSLETLDKLDGEFPDLACFLLITGRKVLTKKITANQPDSKEYLLDRAFPNVDSKDLLCQATSIGEKEFAVSAMRTGFVEDVLKDWPAQYTVLDVAIGVFSLWPLLEQLSSLSSPLGNYQIDVAKGEVQQQSDPSHRDIELYGESLSSQYGLCFLYGLLKTSEENHNSDLASVETNRQDWFYGRLYQKGLLVSAGFIFVLLLVSFLGFSYYSSKTEEMRSQTQAYDQQLSQLDQWKKSYGQKEQFLKANGSQSSQIAILADQISGLIPEEITLEKMSFHPMEKRLKRENLVRYNRDVLLIQGLTKQYSHFQSWTTELKKLDWIKGLEIMGYEEGKDQDEARFWLKLKLES